MLRHLPTVLVCAGIAVYSVAFSLRSIANYRGYRMLFDMAVFEQSFWNASQGRFFQTSLEIVGNHFATHFSPIFFVLLPAYNLRPSPTTLLVLQSVALAMAALPLYGIARRILGNGWLAAIVAVCYLLTPAIMDINTVNDWHEIAFVVPCLMTAYYFALENLPPTPSLRRRGLSELSDADVAQIPEAAREHEPKSYPLSFLGQRFVAFVGTKAQGRKTSKAGVWFSIPLYFLFVLLALMTKEDQGFTIAAFGLWVAFGLRRWRLGLATLVLALAYTLLAILVFVPIYRGNAPYVPVNAYPELGATLPDIIGTIVGNPAKVAGLLTLPDKLGYVQWLLLPLGGLALLAPDVLVVALPALFINLAASNPAFFTIYERYTAPLVPTLFVAAVFGIARLGKIAAWIGSKWLKGSRRDTAPTHLWGMWLGLAVLVVATFSAQATLKRIPTDFGRASDLHAVRAITIIEKIPQAASFAPADNRALVFGAHRRKLAILSYDTLLYDYVLFDDTRTPITPTKPDELADIRRILIGKYQVVYNEDGLLLLADKKAFKRDQATWQR